MCLCLEWQTLVVDWSVWVESVVRVSDLGWVTVRSVWSVDVVLSVTTWVRVSVVVVLRMSRMVRVVGMVRMGQMVWGV